MTPKIIKFLSRDPSGIRGENYTGCPLNWQGRVWITIRLSGDLVENFVNKIFWTLTLVKETENSTFIWCSFDKGGSEPPIEKLHIHKTFHGEGEQKSWTPLYSRTQGTRGMRLSMVTEDSVSIFKQRGRYCWSIVRVYRISVPG